MTAVGILGVGHLATYLVEGLYAHPDPPRVLLSPRNRDRAAELSRRFGATPMASNEELVEHADVVVLATRPADAVVAIEGLSWRDRLLVSVATGVSIAELRAVAAPATVVRAMPVSCAALRRSPTALHPDHPGARSLFERIGSVHALPDEDAFTAASVLGAWYAWTFALLGQAVHWTESAGVPPAIARALVTELAAGAIEMVRERAEQPIDRMLESLATAGGITELGLGVLRDRGALAAWSEACAAVLTRLQDAAK